MTGAQGHFRRNGPSSHFQVILPQEADEEGSPGGSQPSLLGHSCQAAAPACFFLLLMPLGVSSEPVTEAQPPGCLVLRKALE